MFKVPFDFFQLYMIRYYKKEELKKLSIMCKQNRWNTEGSRQSLLKGKDFQNEILPHGKDKSKVHWVKYGLKVKSKSGVDVRSLLNFLKTYNTYILITYILSARQNEF